MVQSNKGRGFTTTREGASKRADDAKRGAAAEEAAAAQQGYAAERAVSPRGSSRKGGGASDAGPIDAVAGVPSTGDIPSLPEMLPLPAADASISHYKGTPLRNIGRDARGRVIPHVRSSKVAARIAVWVAAGYSENDIAVQLNIRPGLLREIYGTELRHGKERVGMEVAEHITARAKKSDQMAIFYAKSQMGWRDGNSKPTDAEVFNLVIHT